MVGAVLFAVVARLPFLRAPLGADEAGFLLVAEQWRPGTSLYGRYWVDRPPLLVDLFGVADRFGQMVGAAAAVRLIGVVVAVAAVLGAGWAAAGAARLLAVDPGRRAAMIGAAAVCAAVFVSSPAFGAQAVDGELLSLPWTLAGIGCLLRAWPGGGQRRRRALLWWVLAGAAEAAAMLVKQNMIEVFLLAIVAAATVPRTPGRSHPRRLGPPARRARGARAVGLAALAVGALALGGAVLAAAAARGTSPAGLWDAVVAFRWQASAVIATEANDATPTRGGHLLEALLVSGAPLLAATAATTHWCARRADPDNGGRSLLLRLMLLCLAWETVGVAAGGSYWLHYLLGTVPGLVLAAVSVGGLARRPRRWSLAAVAPAAVVCAVALSAQVAAPPAAPPGATAAAFVRARATPGETAMVAFGNPALQRATGLPSPYPQLWSLPVRVRDSDLADLTTLLSGPDASDWLVVDGASLATWGVDETSAQCQLQAHYELVALRGQYTVYRRRRR